MSSVQKMMQEASQHISDRLNWSTASRDQATIAERLAKGKDIPEVYGLGEAGIFDEFFCFLDHFNISKLFSKLNPMHKQRKPNVNFHSVMLIYLIRIVSGLAYFSHIDPVLLKSQSLMRITGFNGVEIKKGTTKREDWV